MPPKPSNPTKRLFLVDAMGYIFRAFFAPMDRLQTSTGIPTKVPYLFATMMRRLRQSKDLRPDYLAIATHKRDLDRQVVRHRRALGLVLGEDLVSERGRADVENHRQVVGPQVLTLYQPPHHRGEQVGDFRRDAG